MDRLSNPRERRDATAGDVAMVGAAPASVDATSATIVSPSADRVQWLQDRIAFRRHWQEGNPDWFDLLAREGMDEEGVPFGEPTFR